MPSWLITNGSGEERESTRLLICESFPSHVRHVFRVCRMRLLKGSLMPSPVLWWSSRQCTVRSCILVLTYIDPQRASFRTIYWFYSRGVNFILHYLFGPWHLEVGHSYLWPDVERVCIKGADIFRISLSSVAIEDDKKVSAPFPRNDFTRQYNMSRDL